jgi:RNA polymerase sigma factor (sigma-70 family)
MALADPDLLRTVQSASATQQLRDEFAFRFVGYLRFIAGRQCSLYKLDYSMVDDVVNSAIVMILDDEVARFDTARGSHLSYLSGIVRNAAKSHGRFIHRGSKKRHNWSDNRLEHLGLPSCLEEVSDAEVSCQVEISDVLDRILQMATAPERTLVELHYFRHEPLDSMAESLGVARTTVSRRLERLCTRVAAAMAV